MSDEKQTSESLPDTITWEMLNAYVDQELDPRRAALVADAVACDHGLAARVATLSKLRRRRENCPPHRMRHGRLRSGPSPDSGPGASWL